MVGVLMIGFAIMDGYDLGVAGLLPLVGKTGVERRAILNTIAPHWDGNQVWLIALGGCIFAGWPQVYATSFSGFYFAMLIILYTLIIRPLCLEYRAKVSESKKKLCDIGLWISGLLVPILAGAAIGNLFHGFGFELDDSIRSTFTEGFFGLLNPFAIFCGVLSLCMIWMHGATWLGLRTQDSEVRQRSEKCAKLFAVLVIVLFAAGGFWVAHIPGYEVTNIDPSGPANPLNKLVEIKDGAWLANYSLYPAMIIAPILGFTGAIVTFLTVSRISWLGFLGSAISLAGIIATAGISLFPFLMPSNTSPESSLTVWDATSSFNTLSITVWVAFVFITLIILYTAWCHYKMWRRIGKKTIESEGHSLY